MKPINFIKTVSPQEQQVISRWLALSAALFIISMISMLFISLQQLRTIQTLRSETNSCACPAAQGGQQSLEARKKEIDADKQCLEKQLIKLEQLTQHPESPLPLLQAITDSCAKNQIQLLSCSINKHTLSLRGLGFQPEYALNLLAKLKEIPQLTRVTLVSLEKQQSNAGKPAFACTITGEIASLH